MEKLSKNKRVAREEKQRDQKMEEQVLKSLDDCPNDEEKVKQLLQRSVESEKTVNRLTTEIRAMQRQMENQQRELNKSVLMRDKLQEVCREQQRIIKSVKNEGMLQIKVEEERRKESQLKFQSSLNEVQKSLAKNNDENIKLRDYNIEMTKKLKLLAEQYQTREQHLEKLNEQVHLESQLHQAKLNKAQVEAAMEKEILTKENQIGLEKLLQAQRAIKALTEREQQLKEQLNIYTAKYDDFQQSLQKSNEVFGSYKVELEKMSKNSKKIEKEALGWRQKYEKSNAMVIELATEKQLRDQQADRLHKQVVQLQKLLRALQLERTSLHNCLRDNNIEIPAMPQLPPEPEPIKVTPVNTTDKAKMELMSRNCAELKQTLANLQNQMKLLTTSEGKSVASEEQQPSHQQNKQANSTNNKKNQKKKDKKSKAKAKANAAVANAEPTEQETEPNQHDEIVEEQQLQKQLNADLQQATEDGINITISKDAQQQTTTTTSTTEKVPNDSFESDGSDDDGCVTPTPTAIPETTATVDISEVPALIDTAAD
ncbi:alpha-taxilin [Drosophila tropicalis]|uniref:alpha-taxilin n=1 Tax=Drosophila tropicalis TaxID=46794 RepID=UPI0035AC2357